MEGIDKKLLDLGYGRTTKAIMIPLPILRTWTDEELLQLKDAKGVNLIITPKIRRYLTERYAAIGMRRRDINKLFDENEI